MAKDWIFLCEEGEETFVRFDGERFESAASKEAKKGFCGAVAPVEIVRSHSFKIPLSTSEEKLSTMIEITMFEEGGLDIDKEYAITHVKHTLDFEGSWLVEAFAVEIGELKERFAAPLGAVGHIDLIAVPYLVYESLYRYEKADSSKIELFLYLGEEASYAVLCKEGKYLTHRSLPSLASIALKANVSVEALKESLKERGLDASRYGPDEGLLLATLQSSMANIVERVAHAVSHKRGLFGIGNIDTILLDCDQAEIPGLWELFDGYGFEESRKGVVVCCEALDPARQHRGVEALYLLAAAQERLEAPNLTIFEKRPAFLKTHTGRFVAAVVAAGILVAGYGGMTAMELEGLKEERATLQSRLAALKKRSNALMKKVKEERARKEETGQRLQKRKLELMAFEEAADTMMLIKASRVKRQAMVRDVDEALARYRLLATSLDQNGSRTLRVDVLTGFAQRDRIAKFMKALVDRGYEQVGTREIKLDENLYQSSVEIVR